MAELVKAAKSFPLRSAEQIFGMLQSDPSSVIVDASKAAELWKVFRKSALPAESFSPFAYRAFLQAALMSAIDGSFAMSWVEAVFRSCYTPNPTVGRLLTALVRTAFKHYYDHWTKKPPELYQSVINTISWSHRAYFDSIENGLDL